MSNKNKKPTTPILPTDTNTHVIDDVTLSMPGVASADLATKIAEREAAAGSRIVDATSKVETFRAAPGERVDFNSPIVDAAAIASTIDASHEDVIIDAEPSRPARKLDPLGPPMIDGGLPEHKALTSVVDAAIDLARIDNRTPEEKAIADAKLLPGHDHDAKPGSVMTAQSFTAPIDPAAFAAAASELHDEDKTKAVDLEDHAIAAVRSGSPDVVPARTIASGGNDLPIVRANAVRDHELGKRRGAIVGSATHGSVEPRAKASSPDAVPDIEKIVKASDLATKLNAQSDVEASNARDLDDDDAMPDDVTERRGTLDGLLQLGDPYTGDRAEQWREMVRKELKRGHHGSGIVVADDVETTQRILDMARDSAARVLEYALQNPGHGDQLVHDIVICALAAGHYANVDEQSTAKGREARRHRRNKGVI